MILVLITNIYIIFFKIVKSSRLGLQFKCDNMLDSPPMCKQKASHVQICTEDETKDGSRPFGESKGAEI